MNPRSGASPVRAVLAVANYRRFVAGQSARTGISGF
jgi:hypothetical protein